MNEPTMPPDPFPTNCPGCANSTNVHVGHGLILDGPVFDADGQPIDLRLAD